MIINDQSFRGLAKETENPLGYSAGSAGLVWHILDIPPSLADIRLIFRCACVPCVGYYTELVPQLLDICWELAQLV
jgi:hypothetical protein